MTPRTRCSRRTAVSRRPHGQALTEFALVMPILALMIMAIFDFGRGLFAYIQSSNYLREALRNAQVLGYDGSAEVYADCGLLRQEIARGFFVGTPTVTINYTNHKDGSVINCPPGLARIDPTLLETGDILTIDVVNTVPLITPLINSVLPQLTFNFSGQRTIVIDIPLSDNFDDDSDFDGLNDEWEIRLFGDLSQTGTNDPDNDFCNNGCEETRATFPTDADSDNDRDFNGVVGLIPTGLLDGEEVYVYLTDPNDPDTDNDLVNDYDEVIVYLTDPNDPDTDNDGANDGQELSAGSNPLIPDTDGDGLTDGQEINTYGTNPTLRDSDGDGLDDPVETASGTNPTNPDTDGDGLNDGGEQTAGSDPFVRDTDGDGLEDGPEVLTHGTNPRLADTDGDTMPDSLEITNGTDPNNADQDNDGLRDDREVLWRTIIGNPDSDGDGLSDGDEVNRYRTNPNNPDTDLDGVSDADEIAAGTDPRGGDGDRDGLPDGWELDFFLTTAQTATGDPDNDGCNNLCEYINNSNPTNGDIDNDGLLDGAEVAAGTRFDNPDTDGDGLLDGREVAAGTNPVNDSDTDDDTLSDYDEVMVHFTSPTRTDTDSDGLSDAAEVNTTRTLPNNPRSDADDLTDGEEVNVYRTDPLDDDSDNDGLLDHQEVDGARNGGTFCTITLTVTGTTTAANRAFDSDPLALDTDSDGLSDSEECLTFLTNPTNRDTDGDWISTDPTAPDLRDRAEAIQPLIAANEDTSPSNWDTDRDGRSDALESRTTNLLLANDSDTDNDGLLDGQEFIPGEASTCPSALNPDSDGDLLSDGSLTPAPLTATETSRGTGTDPCLADTDGDSINDRLDAHPLDRPRLVLENLNPTGVTEPNSDTDPAVFINFRVTLQFGNVGQPVAFSYATSAITGQATMSANVLTCDNGNSEDFRRINLTTTSLTASAVVPQPTLTIPVRLCSGGNRNESTETFNLTFSGVTTGTRVLANGTDNTAAVGSTYNIVGSILNLP